MMTLAVDWAFNQHKQYIYLGTAYTSGSLYKSQFNGFEFFNGFSWSDNLEELKYLVNRDSSNYTLQDINYREQLLNSGDDWMETEKGMRVGLK
jgi:hypothetical protein